MLLVLLLTTNIKIMYHNVLGAKPQTGTIIEQTCTKTELKSYALSWFTGILLAILVTLNTNDLFGLMCWMK